MWTKTDYTNAAAMGTGNLLGLALGTFAEYRGTPEEVGMLLRGVATTAVFGSAAAGAQLWGNYTQAGRMQSSAPSGGSGRVIQKLGHSLGQQTVVVGGSTYIETIVVFNPELTYTTT